MLRNNLTVLDYVKLQGVCSRGFITVEGVHPVSAAGTSTNAVDTNSADGNTLLFEFSTSMLEGYLNGMECKSYDVHVTLHVLTCILKICV